MSTRAKRAKPSAKREASKEAPVAKPRPVKPSGRVPAAIVNARRRFSMIERRGKGFSRGELSEGGLPMNLALKWHVPVDPRRKSKIEANVSAVRKWYSQPKKAEGISAPKQPQASLRKRASKKKET